MHWLILLLTVAHTCFAQNFVRVTDPNNPVATEPGGAGYMGCGWADYDGDGDEDLLSNPNRLYRNDGGGNFSIVQNAFLSASGLGTGCSWADVDNDGDLDVCIAGNPSTLYRNHNGVFAPDSSGDMRRAASNRGWSPAFADYNNDGFVDLVITHPANFAGAPQPNHLFLNSGPPDYGFVRDTTTDVTVGLHPYTVGTWSDFDWDGDYDYFIGAGPAGSQPGPDYLYRNMLTESGSADLVRMETGPLAETDRDGQVYNWIDYDNDGDLDGYITNWGGSLPGGGLENELYRNDNGTFTRVTEGEIVTDRDVSLGNLWADFDNDGDLDCFVTNDNQPARFYANNGDGSFTSQTNAATVTGNHRGAAAADYDNDGDLDLFVNGVSAAKKLFQNDLANGNHWVKLRCEGVQSNRAAIGTKVRVKAAIHGNGVWQLREISAQNSFSSHNSLLVHVGLGDAAVIDSLIVNWPAGGTQVFTNLAVDQQYFITEGEQSAADGERPAVAVNFGLEQNFPNPFNGVTTIRFAVPNGEAAALRVFDSLGREVARPWNGVAGNGVQVVPLDLDGLASGRYWYRLETKGGQATQSMLLLK